MKFLPRAVLLALALSLGGCAGGKSSDGVESAYSHRLHDRFYREWQQPAAVSARRGKISVPVDVNLDPKGRVIGFRRQRSSGDPAIDASIDVVGKKVRQVARPPASAHQPFHLRIYFELDVH
ncbi:MAG: TonB family protein [Chthoniobacterales bacterium]